jgi:PAS domain S-box-containing protein
MKSEEIRVLLISDDEDDYILTRELLSNVEAGKYALDWASSYEEGLAVASRREHHVCLVDHRLGEHTGVQLIREARISRITTPMILLTRLGNYEVDREAMHAGATNCLVKDETPPALLERTIRYTVQLNTERCRAEEALGCYAQKQAAVAEIGRLALAGGELSDLLAEAVALVRRTLGVEYCKVLELLPEDEVLILRAGVGWKEEYPVGQATVGAGKESQAGFTLLSDEPVVVEDLRTETRFSGPPLLHDHGVVSGMSVTIRGRERPYGVLGAHTTSLRRFTTDDVNFVVAVANVLAEAIGRRHAEDALRQSEARFRRVVESNIFGIISWQLSGEITEANDAFLKMVGYTRDDLATGRMRWTEMTPTRYGQPDEIALSQLAASGVCETYEKEYIRKDGSRVPILLGCAMLEGENQRGVGFVLDITERKKTENALRESNEKFYQLADNITDAFWIRSPDLREVHYISPAFERIWGCPPESLYTNPQQWTDFILPEDRERVLATFATLTGAAPSISIEYRIARPDGEVRWIHVRGFQVRNAADELIRLTGIVTDITERKRAEAERTRLVSELESERTRLVDIFTHAPAFIASLRGPDHIFELANAHFYSLVGQRDLIGRKARSAFPDVIGQGFFHELEKVYATGVPFVGNEMPIEFSDGPGPPRELRYINFVLQPLSDLDGTVSGIICHGVDVTEQVLSRRRLEETENQLRQSQKLESVGMLAGGIAHDFNNLLTVITGYSELTLRLLDKADPVARNIEEIKKASERATLLTRQLLAFSRKQLLQPKVLDLNSVIAEIEVMLRRLVGEDIELHTSLGVGLGRVKADPGQIDQVIVNLVVNAKDAMPKGGTITLETARIYLNEAYAHRHIAVQSGWYALLAVSDTGHGMEAETQKHIFEPFFTTKGQGKGTGLGLSTVYGIVKQSGGNVWVYSETDVGTTFKIYLPLIDEQVEEPEADAPRAESAAGTETILLAEDEDMVRNLARECLEMHGYTVLAGANAEEALLISQQHEGPIHLLLTDVVMPRVSGKELADQLKQLRPDTRVLFMSGYTDQAIVHHGILDGDISFIAKPFTPDALVLKVVEVLQQDVSSRESRQRMDSPGL